jgi:hypothetical protein
LAISGVIDRNLHFCTSDSDWLTDCQLLVMPGLVPGIHEFLVK